LAPTKQSEMNRERMNTDNLQLDALAAERDLRQRIVELATSYRRLRDKGLMDLCRKAWAGDERSGGVVGQLWVECLLPSELGDNTLATHVFRVEWSMQSMRSGLGYFSRTCS
jgi:hypothetical protein